MANDQENTNQEQTTEQTSAAADEQAADNNEPAKLSPEEEIKELNDKYLRSLAEMQNLRARVSKDLDDARKYAISGFAQDLINVLENLHRAKDNIPGEKQEDETVKRIKEGVEMTLDELESAFKRHGVERVNPNPGDTFDYRYHQAVVQVPTEEFEEGKIYNVVQAGYVIKDRILRPAIVAVSKKTAVKTDGGEATA